MTGKIEIPLSGHDKNSGESYSDYLVRLTKRMNEQALVLQDIHKNRDAFKAGWFEKINTEIKDEVEKLVSVITERDRMLD